MSPVDLRFNVDHAGRPCLFKGEGNAGGVARDELCQQLRQSPGLDQMVMSEYFVMAL